MATLARFPIGFWNNGDDLLEADPVERVNEWVELGFTWAMTPGFDGNDPQRRQQVTRLLDLAHERGIKMLIFDRRAEAPGSPWTEPTRSLPLAPNYKITAAAAVRDWAGHPAAWGLYVCDEPLIGNLPAVAEACRFVRSLNSGLHPYVNLLPDHRIDGGVARQVGFTDFNAYLDDYLAVTGDTLLCYDCYCQTAPEFGGRERYFLNLAEVQAASLRHKAPFWLITLSMGHWMYRTPTEHELRWEFNTALAYGAQGVLWFLYRGGGRFGYGAPVDELGQRGPLFAAMRRLHRWFQQHWEERFRRLTITRTMHLPVAPHGCLPFVADGLVSSIRTDLGVADLLIAEGHDDQGRGHVMVVNNDCVNHVRLDLRLRGSRFFRVDEGGEALLGDSAAAVGPVGCGDYLMPGAALLFRVEA